MIKIKMCMLLISVYCSIAIIKVLYGHWEEWRPILMHIYFTLIQYLNRKKKKHQGLFSAMQLFCTYSSNLSIVLAIML